MSLLVLCCSCVAGVEAGPAPDFCVASSLSKYLVPTTVQGMYVCNCNDLVQLT